MSASGIDTSTLDEDVMDSLPWPVRDGRWQDVNERNVEDFFRHAQDGVHDASGSLLMLLRLQAMRWHEDRLRRVFPRMAEREDVMALTTMVMQVVNRMTQTARAKL